MKEKYRGREEEVGEERAVMSKVVGCNMYIKG